MSRRQLAFQSEGCALGATLDEADGTSGLLIVSGGNEIRAGAFNGQAQLAGNVAKAGYPVFRFDRRGIGDSEGENLGFRNSSEDIRAALAAFRAAAPKISRVVAFGNCDAASALMLSQGAGCHALALSNPWTITDGLERDPLPPPEAVRARYLAKLRAPRELWRLATGGVDLRKLATGLRRAGSSSPKRSTLAAEMADGLQEFGGPVRFLLADGDQTAQSFLAHWDASDPRITRCPRAGHSYAEPHAFAWLTQELVAFLES